MTTESVYKTPAGEKAVMELYDRALANWPLPYEALTIPTLYGSTFVIACGDPAAPPLVLLHGAGANSAIWIGDVPDYCRRYRVYGIDLLGEAGKSAQVRPAWDSPAYADWLAEVFDALKIERVVLGGISQGGWTSLKFAVTYPERVERLVLMCPGGVVRDRMSFFFRVIALSLLGRRGIPRILRLLYADQPLPDGLEEIMSVVMPQFKSRMGMLPIFSDDELRRLTMPILLIGGSKDALRGLDAIAARLRPLLPDLLVHIIPNAGHALANTTGLVMSFLEG